MGELQRGDVVLVHFPFTDLRSSKLRPAIVLARHGEDVIVVGVFSNVEAVSLKDTWLLIDERNPHFAQTGLRKSSIVKGEKVAILHGSVIHSAIGSLPPALFESLLHKVKAALQLP